jgi:hypothetical protein
VGCSEPARAQGPSNDVDGRIIELTVMICSLKGLQRVVEEMGKVLSSGPPEAKA